jgi:hypothetical protein
MRFDVLDESDTEFMMVDESSDSQSRWEHLNTAELKHLKVNAAQANQIAHQANLFSRQFSHSEALRLQYKSAGVPGF